MASNTDVKLWGGSFNPFETPIADDGLYLETVDTQLDPLRKRKHDPVNMDSEQYYEIIFLYGSGACHNKKNQKLMVIKQPLTGCAGIKTGKKASPAEKRRPTGKKCIGLRRKNGVTERIFARAAA